MRTVSTQKLEVQIHALDDLTRDVLVKQWITLFGGLPLKAARRVTLIRGIAYALQCKAASDLKPSTSKQLLKIARSGNVALNSPRGSFEASSKPRTQIGSQLMREWNGRTYSVIVSDNGFVMNGLTYASLSAVAKEITGAHWSGPRFFGVKQ
jgi:hypothetical protein